MAIDPKMRKIKQWDIIVGQVNMGGVLVVQVGKPILAKRLLAFHMTGLSTAFKCPVAYFFVGRFPDSTLQFHRRPKHVTLRRLGCTWHIAESQVYIPRTSFTYGQCPLRRDLIAVLIPSHWMDFRRTWDGKRISRSH
jgi:hypothetical protein